MSDRIAELRRQRAMVAEQLAWLDREIAGAEKNAPTPPAAPASAPAPVAIPVITTTVAAPVLPLAPEVAAQADAILEEYRVQPDSLRTDVKKGCFLYFAAAMGLLGAVVMMLYFALKKN